MFPDFAQIARYAGLAGDRRLLEIGIKTYRQRGEGTDRVRELASLCVPADVLEHRIGEDHVEGDREPRRVELWHCSAGIAQDGGDPVDVAVSRLADVEHRDVSGPHRGLHPCVDGSAKVDDGHVGQIREYPAREVEPARPGPPPDRSWRLDHEMPDTR